jgi:phosphoenolpyruvate synthase/pyruvate phosphate dikinase
LASICDFFSFGTNDLTQTTWGLSRDDAGSFLPSYEAERLIAVDPFKSLDQQGVGQLMRMAVESGRAANLGLKIGICGEHGAIRQRQILPQLRTKLRLLLPLPRGGGTVELRVFCPF